MHLKNLMKEIGFSENNNDASHKYIVKNTIISIRCGNIFEVFALKNNGNNILLEIQECKNNSKSNFMKEIF